MSNPPVVKTNAYLPWIVVFVASLFFFYEQVNMFIFNAISAQVMQTFSLSATQLGNLSATYFYATVLFLLPAGIILDRLSIRAVMLTALTICVFGAFLFAVSVNVWMAAISRFLTGIGSAFCFLSCIRLASRWFPPQRLAFITGLVVTMSMLGGVAAQTPMTIITDNYGWRMAIFADVAIGVAVIALIWWLVRDAPEHLVGHVQREQKYLASLGYWRSLRQSFLRLRNWLYGIYSSLLNLPIFLLGGLWGTMYLTKVHHLSNTTASLITTALFFGAIVGCPVLGWISDHFKVRRLPMIIGALFSLLTVALIITLPNLTANALIGLFFWLGFITSSQIISYAAVMESNAKMLTATSASVVSMSVIGGGAIFEPLSGWLMDLHRHGAIAHSAPVYSAADFQFSMLLFPIAIVVALALTFFIKETYQRRDEESSTTLEAEQLSA